MFGLSEWITGVLLENIVARHLEFIPYQTGFDTRENKLQMCRIMRVCSESAL